MPSLTLQGVVLRYANYRERDRMLTLLTPDHGRVDVLSRGCRRPNSQLMVASELFVHGEYVAFQSHDRLTLTSCTPQDTFYPLRLDAYRLTCASYLVSLVQAAAQPEQPAEGMYALLLQGLYRLSYCLSDPPLAAVNAFLLLYAAEAGYRPRLSHCIHCGKPLPAGRGARLDTEAGGLCCDACRGEGQYALTSAQVERMRGVLEGGFDAAGCEADTALFEAMRCYVENRLECRIKCSQFLP
ncbi:MAG: DNA repair protein RecO [Eubacteriales bacterium]|nr:DNA repair protein RecO [Eubacteriales bacterium]